MNKEIDHSPYEVALRLDRAMELLEIQDRINSQTAEALELLTNMQQNILERLENLETSRSTISLKRTAKNE